MLAVDVAALRARLARLRGMAGQSAPSPLVAPNTPLTQDNPDVSVAAIAPFSLGDVSLLES